MAALDPSELTLHEVQTRLKWSLGCFYYSDHYLIEERICEWSVSHRVAVYLEPQFPGWNIDCEFNRDGTNPKIAEELKRSKRPDVIVHCRGQQGPNLLAVEVKMSSRINAKDCKKAKRYIDKLNYRWAVCLSLELDAAHSAWFGEGNVNIEQTYSVAELHAQFAESAKLEQAIKANLKSWIP